MSEQPEQKPISRRKPQSKTALIKRKVLAGVLAGKSGTQAALDAGCPPASAHVRASEILAEPGIRARIQRALDKADASIDDAAKAVGRGIRAKTTKFLLGKEGELIETPAREDLPTQVRAAELAMKLHGGLDPRLPTANELMGFAAVVGIIAAESKRRGLAIPTQAESDLPKLDK